MTPEQLAAIRERAEARAAYSDERGEDDFDHNEWTALADESAADVPALLDHVDEVNSAASSFAQALSSVTADNVRLGDTLQAIRKLHTSVKPDSDGEHYLDPLTRKPKCGECLLIYPCPTIQAIEGGTDGSQ